MRESVRWNAIQGELLSKGYENNFFNEESCSVSGFTRRSPSGSYWRARTFAPGDGSRRCVRGGDRNTGLNEYVVKFVLSAQVEAGLGILSFYVTHNERF